MKKHETYHIPVLLRECIEGLAIKSDGVYLDCTVGGGGHFSEIFKMLNSKGTAIGIDRDPVAIEWVREYCDKTQSRVILEQSTFSHFDTVLEKHGIKELDGMILDLGISSRQIDDLQRGFSYKTRAPLDMRMNPADMITAEKILSESSCDELAFILQEYGEVRNAPRMADTIVNFLKMQPITNSEELRKCLEQEYGSPVKYKVLSKVFQALRIAVNNELEELRLCLSKAVCYLQKGGRLVVIAYHSLEDRIVKKFIRENEQACICPPHEPICRCDKVQLLKRINRKAYCASTTEIKKNSRARSARLRIAEKVAGN